MMMRNEQCITAIPAVLNLKRRIYRKKTMAWRDLIMMRFPSALAAESR